MTRADRVTADAVPLDLARAIENRLVDVAVVVDLVRLAFGVDDRAELRRCDLFACDEVRRVTLEAGELVALHRHREAERLDERFDVATAAAARRSLRQEL